ncbi:MAG: galactokinase [Nocardioidaceae bacterium]
MTSTWSAPGRVNLIGEHVDYNDGLVLPFALPQITTATVSTVPGKSVTVSSRGETERFAVDVEPGDVNGWSAYVAGVIWAIRQDSADIPGLHVELESDVPIGAGLSSSAALSCSVAAATADELGLSIDRQRVAGLARRAENEFVGVPTGSMDQLASMLCVEGHALLLDCRDLSSRLLSFEPESAGLTLLVVDTHATHELTGGEYADRRRACEHAANHLGVESLRDATLAQLDDISDATLRRRAHHVVTEIARVRDVVEILDDGDVADIGASLTASHESLRDDFEVSCEELDVAVDAAMSSAALGARMTGGGFGGAAIVLARSEDSARIVKAVQTSYDAQGWRPPTIWPARPSAGARRHSPNG